MNIYTFILFGFFGGAVRSLVGLLKHKVLSGKEKFKPKRLIFTLVCSGLIGLFCSLLLIEDYRLVLLAGYAGTDLIQGLYKTLKKGTNE